MNKNFIRILMIIVAIIAIAVIVVVSLYTHDDGSITISHDGKTHRINMQGYSRAKTSTIPKAVAIDTSKQPVLGDKNAALKIVAFEDLKCSACQRYNVTLFPKIKKQYIDTGKANYTVINLAFITGSLPAANAARCLYDQKPKAFFDFVEYVYAHQPPEAEDWATVPNLLQMASHVKGVNQKKFSTCLIRQPYDAMFTKNMEIAQKTMGSSISTPTVYINGVHVAPLTLEQFTKIADKES